MSGSARVECSTGSWSRVAQHVLGPPDRLVDLKRLGLEQHQQRFAVDAKQRVRARTHPLPPLRPQSHLMTLIIKFDLEDAASR